MLHPAWNSGIIMQDGTTQSRLRTTDIEKTEGKDMQISSWTELSQMLPCLVGYIKKHSLHPKDYTENY